MPIPRTRLLTYDRPFLLVVDDLGQLLLERLGWALLFPDGVDRVKDGLASGWVGALFGVFLEGDFVDLAEELLFAV